MNTPTNQQTDEQRQAEWRAMAQEPEAQSIGQLNASVRYLREKLYQQAIAHQARVEEMERERTERERAAVALCKVYFEIAEEAFGEEVMRQKRDEKIAAAVREQGGE